jgi:glucose/arabinose dehydrogenase
MKFTSPFFAILVALLLTGCVNGPRILQTKDQKAIDRRISEYPAGWELKPYIVGLNAPSGFCWDDQGNVIIAESGIDSSQPKIYGIRPDNTKFDIFPHGSQIPFVHTGFQIYAPIGGIVSYKGRIFVSHRDSNGMGVITAFGYDGSHTTVVGDLPAQGDYGVTDIVISPLNGRLYFGVGTATNSGVVGLDNWEEGWVKQHPEFSDTPFKAEKLLGYHFTAKNPDASIFVPETSITGPEQSFGSSQKTRIPGSPFGKPTGAIYSISPDGGDLRVEAWGVRNPAGLLINELGSIYFTDQGMELRGTRPVMDDPDVLLHLFRDVWYGWPDFSRSLEPISDDKYQLPPRLSALILPSGYPEVGFIIDHQASGLTEPDRRLVAAEFKPLSGASKMASVPQSDVYPLEWRGELIVALWGDRAPFATSDEPLKKPLSGYKVVRVDPTSHEVKDFIWNTAGGPASQLKDGRNEGLERPIDVKVGPDGYLYFLDFGRIKMYHGKIKVFDDTGRIFRLVPVPAENLPSPSVAAPNVIPPPAAVVPATAVAPATTPATQP